MKSPLVLVLLAAACTGGGRAATAAAGADTSAAPPPTGTPVTVTDVQRATLAITVVAPGRTDVLRPIRVRAPFAGTLTSLSVADGDAVSAGQQLGTVVARTSAAALAGARAMLESARTDQERADAQRALDLATRNLVQQPLRAPEAGLVVSHVANAGDLVNEGDDILTLAPQGSIAFIAQVVQSDLTQVHAGQHAAVELAARPTPLRATVRAILPAASSETMSAPVRIDFSEPVSGISLGLFGTAHITVGDRRDVPVVPSATVLRDDVYGTSRLAIVTNGHAHWLTVTTGARDSSRVEILTPTLAPGTAVIVTGQVGLPEGTPVQPQP